MAPALLASSHLGSDAASDAPTGTQTGVPYHPPPRNDCEAHRTPDPRCGATLAPPTRRGPSTPGDPDPPGPWPPPRNIAGTDFFHPQRRGSAPADPLRSRVLVSTKPQRRVFGVLRVDDAANDRKSSS